VQIRDEGPQWSDDPATAADISGRPAFVSAVAARIGRVDDRQASTVFGLVGPWGSGKTTLLRDVAGRLSDWTPVWFSPWSVSDVGALTGEFLAALSEAFPRNAGLKQRFASYSRFGVPALKAIPMIGDAVAGVASEVVQAAASRPAWHTEFESLSEEIAAEGRRVLVIVDDVDRLDESELRALLRVIRLLGRFRNVHYLIAYDQATIDDLLGAGGGRSADFMEKIVQYPFEVPPVPTVVRRRWARAAIDAQLRGADRDAATRPSSARRSAPRRSATRWTASGPSTGNTASRWTSSPPGSRPR
jgi:predicted KAP-like P-loop ATPase